MSTTVGPQLASAALRNAFPYIRLYQGKTFVIKAGGEAFADREGSRALLEQVSILHRLGIRVILVHGGGPQISSLSERLDIQPQFIDGRRVTSPEALEVAVMTLCGTINKRLVGAFRELETPAVGVSGVDGGTICATRRPPRPRDDGGTVDFGEVGDIETVDPTFTAKLLEQGYLPVFSPVSANAAGELLNINADVVAARLAIALSAEKLIYMTGAPGILLDASDPSSLLSYSDVEGLRRLEEEGVLEGGMIPKVESLAGALQAGVSRVHVISHRSPDTLLMEVFTNEGSGTLVVRDMEQMKPMELNPKEMDVTS